MKLDLKKVDHPWTVLAWDIGGTLPLGTAENDIEATELIVNYFNDGGVGNASAVQYRIINGQRVPEDDDDIPPQG